MVGRTRDSVRGDCNLLPCSLQMWQYTAEVMTSLHSMMVMIMMTGSHRERASSCVVAGREFDSCRCMEYLRVLLYGGETKLQSVACVCFRF